MSKDELPPIEFDRKVDSYEFFYRERSGKRLSQRNPINRLPCRTKRAIRRRRVYCP